MAIHVLLNLLSELRKRDKMPGFAEHFLLFHIKFNAGAQMLDSIHHIILKKKGLQNNASVI